MNINSFDPLTPEILKASYKKIWQKDPNRQEAYFSLFFCGCAISNFGHTELCTKHAPKIKKSKTIEY